jgi:hypothetical protein
MLILKLHLVINPLFLTSIKIFLFAVYNLNVPDFSDTDNKPIERGVEYG